MHKRWDLLLCAALVFALSACGTDPAPSPEPTPTTQATSSESPAGPSPRPSSTFEIPDQEPETIATAEKLLATGGEVSPYEFLHVQIAAQRAATHVTSTTVDPQWDTKRIIHVDRSQPQEPVYYVRTETGEEVTEMLERDGMRWERTNDGPWQETSHDPAEPAGVHDSAVQQAAQYSSVTLVSQPDQLFRLIPYDLGMVPALMHVDNQLRPVRIESEGLEGSTVYAYDEPMELPVIG